MSLIIIYIEAVNLCVLCVFVVPSIGDSETIQDIPYLQEKLCILIISQSRETNRTDKDYLSPDRPPGRSRVKIGVR